MTEVLVCERLEGGTYGQGRRSKLTSPSDRRSANRCAATQMTSASKVPAALTTISRGGSYADRNNQEPRFSPAVARRHRRAIRVTPCLSARRCQRPDVLGCVPAIARGGKIDLRPARKQAVHSSDGPLLRRDRLAEHSRQRPRTVWSSGNGDPFPSWRARAHRHRGAFHQRVPVRKPEAFLELIRAATAFGAGQTGALGAFLAAHPNAKRFVETPKPIPTSFARDACFAVTSVKFTTAKCVSRHGRFRIRPEVGTHDL